MRRLLFPLTALFVLALVGRADAGWSDVKKRLVRSVEDREPISVTLKAARAVIEDGKPRATKLLCDVVDEIVDREWTALEEAQRLAARIFKDKDNWAREIDLEIDGLLRAAAVDQELAMRLGDELAEAPEPFRRALVEAAKKRKDGHTLKVAVRMMANRAKDSAASSFILEVVAGAEDPRIRLAGLRALEPFAEDWSGIVADRVSDPDWNVQVDAARISAAHGIGASIGDMIGGLSCAAPRVQMAFTAALQAMTGETFGIQPDRWKFWWDTARKNWEDARVAKGGNCVHMRYVPFYDLEIHSRRVLFVIDVSLSMGGPAIEYIDPAGKPIESDKFTRLDRVKSELQRAIRGLPEDASFNLVAFSDDVEAWRDEMQVADERAQKGALKWIDDLKPDGNTRINGALHAVFGRMGFGDATVAPITADTIVVLSDGSPTDGWPEGRGPSAQKVVLEKVSTWNRFQSIIIHTVAIKGHDAKTGADIPFLTDLAEWNGGQCSVR